MKFTVQFTYKMQFVVRSDVKDVGYCFVPSHLVSSVAIRARNKPSRSFHNHGETPTRAFLWLKGFVSYQCLKCESTCRHFKLGEGSSGVRNSEILTKVRCELQQQLSTCCKCFKYSQIFVDTLNRQHKLVSLLHLSLFRFQAVSNLIAWNA